MLDAQLDCDRKVVPLKLPCAWPVSKTQPSSSIC